MFNFQEVFFGWEIDFRSSKSSLCFTLHCTSSLKTMKIILYFFEILEKKFKLTFGGIKTPKKTLNNYLLLFPYNNQNN
jgi:hypothetical protein